MQKDGSSGNKERARYIYTEREYTSSLLRRSWVIFEEGRLECVTPAAAIAASLLSSSSICVLRKKEYEGRTLLIESSAGELFTQFGDVSAASVSQVRINC